jgi:hypothetical protein
VGLVTVVVGDVDGWKGAGLGEQSEGRAGRVPRKMQEGEAGKVRSPGWINCQRVAPGERQSRATIIYRTVPESYRKSAVPVSGADPRNVVFLRAVSLHVVVEDSRGGSTEHSHYSGQR